MNCLRCATTHPTEYYFLRTPSGFVCHTCAAKTPFASTLDYDENRREIPPLAVIRALILNKAIQAATNSLLLWGAINLAAWYVMGADLRGKLGEIPNAGSDFALFLYGGAIVGAAMLVFGAIGLTLKTPAIGWLDGCSLIGVGLWNLAHDFALAAALNSHGYTMKPSTSFWFMLGISQIVWGGKQFHRFSLLGKLPRDVTASAQARAEQRIRERFRSPLAPERGQLACALHEKSFPIPIDNTMVCGVWLMQDVAVCLSHDLSGFFQIERRALAGATIQKSPVEVPTTGGEFKKLICDTPTLEALDLWARLDWASTTALDDVSRRDGHEEGTDAEWFCGDCHGPICEGEVLCRCCGSEIGNVDASTRTKDDREASGTCPQCSGTIVLRDYLAEADPIICDQCKTKVARSAVRAQTERLVDGDIVEGEKGTVQRRSPAAAPARYPQIAVIGLLIIVCILAALVLWLRWIYG